VSTVVGVVLFSDVLGTLLVMLFGLKLLADGGGGDHQNV
jgi:hypothetical protein